VHRSGSHADLSASACGGLKVINADIPPQI